MGLSPATGDRFGGGGADGRFSDTSPLSQFPDDAIASAEADRGLLEEGMGMVEQFTTSFIEGFTALPVAEQPESTAEAIAGSLGHLAGFVGFVPGIGTLGSLSAKGLRATLGGVSKALRVSSTTGRAAKWGDRIKDSMQSGRAAQATSKLSNLTQIKSFPMLAGGQAVKAARMAGKTKAGQAAGRFLSKRFGSEFAEESARMVGREAVRLGTAMGTVDAPRAFMNEDSWEASLDRVMRTTFQGAALGGASAGLGAAFPGKTTEQGIRGLDQLTAGGKATRHALARATGSAAFEGLWSAYRNEPIELQVYNTLLGAYFGIQEIGPVQRKAMRKIQAFRDEGGPERDLQMMAPEQTDMYKESSPEVQQEIKLQGELMFGRMANAIEGQPDAETETMPFLSQVEKLAADRVRNVVEDARQENLDNLAYEDIPEPLRAAVEDEGSLVTEEDARTLTQEAQARKKVAALGRQIAGDEAPGEASTMVASFDRSWPTPAEVRSADLQSDGAMRRVTMDLMRQQTELREAYNDHERIAPLRRDLGIVADEIQRRMEVPETVEVGLEEGPFDAAKPRRAQLEMELAELAGREMEAYGEQGFGEFVKTVEQTYLDGGVRAALKELSPGQLKTVSERRDDRVATQARQELRNRDTDPSVLDQEDLPDTFQLEPQRIDEQSETWRALKRTWKRAVHQQPETQWAWSAEEGTFKQRTEISASGKRTMRQRPRSHMETQVQKEMERLGLDAEARSARVAVETIETPKEDGQGVEEVSVLEAREREEGTIGQMMLDALRSPNTQGEGQTLEDASGRRQGGMALVGGVKDKGRLVFTPLMVRDEGMPSDDPRPTVQDVERRLERANEAIAEANQANGRRADLEADLLQIDEVGPSAVENLRDAFGSLEAAYQQDEIGRAFV